VLVLTLYTCTLLYDRNELECVGNPVAKLGGETKRALGFVFGDNETRSFNEAENNTALNNFLEFGTIR
jgi:hypothetical protein